MNSVTKDKKNINSNNTKSQIQSILKSLIVLNKDKISPNIKKICISQVKSQITKILKRYHRMLKIYWAINIKNQNYKESCGANGYSASDIYSIVIKLLENDGYTRVCKRTIARDIKLLNEMGLLESKIRRLGKNKGSISHYRQNMELAHLHKEIILEYLKELLKENLKDKIIIGNFDKDADNTEFNYTNLEKFGILAKVSKKNRTSNSSDGNKITPMSRVIGSCVFNEANISNNKNSKELLLKKTNLSKLKKEECRFKRSDVETRLICEHKINKNYLNQIKKYSNNDATYINALINLETAIDEYQGEYYIEDILEHFLKQFGNRYKYKIWMMMRRSDGVISDYAVIWEGRFRDWYPNKYKSPCAVKATYGDNLRIGIKKASVIKEKRAKEQLNVEELKEKEIEKAKEREEQRKREAASLQKYLTGLFERESKEREERLKKAREEELNLKKKARESMLASLERSKERCVGLDISNNGKDNMICASSNEEDMVKFAIRDEFGGFKTTKGLGMVNLGIMIEDVGHNENLKEKESK
ncbi:plasmid maintenance protein [Borrelia coriaceae]|uniref:plasmid maintenance protein n=1 Tax=Borrelia coriaceae TaxID=144 RepID=UPI000687FFE3|nr:plasmid maintenance protein [Borrelia coriaceae]